MKRPAITAEQAKHFAGYSQSNAMLVVAALRTRCHNGCQPYQDVYTYERWQAQGMQVQKGEKSIHIPIVKHKMIEDEEEGIIKDVTIKGTACVFCRCQVKPR